MWVTNIRIGKETLFYTNLIIVMTEIRKIQSRRVTVHLNKVWIRFSIRKRIGGVTEIPFVGESSKRELLSLLGNWYEPESYESIFSSIASDAVFFSS